MAAVTIGAVEKWFGSTHVIRGVAIEIADGEFCVLVGPSGCGKSTLLRMIAGLEQIGDGEVSIGNVVVNRMLPKERDIAMVFQNYALYPHMTVRDNMSLALYDRPVSTFVAGFIGSPAMNMLPGVVRMSDGSAHVAFDADARLPLPVGARAADGQSVLYGMRPEHCAIGDKGLPVEVVVVE